MTKRRHTKVIAALDTQNTAQVASWRQELAPSVDSIKLGLEFVCANGFDKLAAVAGDVPYFLDLKLHDIPNTVASSIHSLSAHRPAMLTLHALGGASMLRAARRARDEAFPTGERPLLLGVTVLTSLQDEDLKTLGFAEPVKALVQRLGALSLSCGLDGLVCSGHDLKILRKTLGEDAVLVSPGIRPKGCGQGDQKRVMTPGEACESGADWIVVGRPITQALSPLKVARAIKQELHRVQELV